MSPNQQYKWWLTFSKFIKSREETWTPVIYRALQKQVQPTINVLKEHGLNAAITSAGLSVHMESIAVAIKNIYVDAGRVFGARTYQMVKQQAEKYQKQFILVANEEVKEHYSLYDKTFFAEEEKRLLPIGYNEDLINAINNYYQLFLLTKAVLPITQTTKEFILDRLIKAQREGWSIQQIVNELRDTDITRNRARVIARTETGKATNFSAVWGARKTGYRQNKIWIAAKDFRTRRIAPGGAHEHDQFDHFHMNGVEVGLDDVFQVPRKGGGYEAMQQPHDVNGSAANTIMCRCTCGFRVLVDSVGRPLRS